MKRTLASLACIAQLAMLWASSYDELLDLALSSDSTVKRLFVEEDRAKIAYERSDLARLTPELEAGTGDVTASLSGGDYSVTASPSASLALPSGASLGLGSTIASSSLGPFAKPFAKLGIPLVRGRDDRLVASRKSHFAYALARAARERGELELELKLDKALAAALKAEVTLRSTLRAEAKAALELRRAVDVDGAEPGGNAYRSLQRDLRTVSRSRRDAEAAREEALAALRRFFAPSPPADGELIGDAFPKPVMPERLGAAAASYAAAQAKAAARLSELESEETARRVSLGASLGASYALGSQAVIDAMNDGDAGPGLSAGLEASLGDSGLGVKAGLGWGARAGPSASLSLSWSPKPRGDRELRARDEELAARLRGLDVSDALAAAAADLAALESERRGIELSAMDADADLAFASAELAIYEARLAAGFASPAERDEALFTRDECAARVRAAALERIRWMVEARLLTAGSDAFGVGEE